ncbi:non-ribosomal peptide synthetase, partial [Pseudoalteromonas sp. J010]|uniref:AMP-binding protein n=1 Tax=Pseudoalteromonas sp. J010 TaxID=998465 RepID=UPI000FAF075C
SEQGIGLSWVYDKQLFTQAHIAQLDQHLGRVLTALCALEPTQTVALTQLPMLSAPEQEELLVTLNDTRLCYEQDVCMHERFERQAAATPDAVAVICEEVALTYRELNRRANQLAHYLKIFHGVGPDTLVGLCVERSVEMVIAILGVLKAGGAYVPMAPDYPQERLAYMIADAQLSLVL